MPRRKGSGENHKEKKKGITRGGFSFDTGLRGSEGDCPWRDEEKPLSSLHRSGIFGSWGGRGAAPPEERRAQSNRKIRGKGGKLAIWRNDPFRFRVGGEP